MLNHTSIAACFEHSDLLTVNDLNNKTHPIKGGIALQNEDPCTPIRTLLEDGPGSQGHTFDYEPFNCNNFSICYWSWYYRGCWHQTCPPIDPR